MTYVDSTSRFHMPYKAYLPYFGGPESTPPLKKNIAKYVYINHLASFFGKAV